MGHSNLASSRDLLHSTRGRHTTRQTGAKKGTEHNACYQCTAIYKARHSVEPDPVLGLLPASQEIGQVLWCQQEVVVEVTVADHRSIFHPTRDIAVGAPEGRPRETVQSWTSDRRTKSSLFASSPRFASRKGRPAYRADLMGAIALCDHCFHD